MILRLVLSVTILTALVGTTAPALSVARADAATADIEQQLDELATRLQTLVATDDPTPSGDARRVVRLRLPARTYTNTGVRQFRFQERSGAGVATWQVESRRETRRLVGVPIRTTPATRSLEEPGTHRLVFALRRDDGRRVVTVHRFKSEAGESTGHA